MKKLYFVRHGESTYNVEGRYAGVSNPPLTALGKKQAKTTGTNAKKLVVDYILSSPSRRALDTAKIIAVEIGYPSDKIHINSLVMERNFGELEAQLWRGDIDIDGFVDVESIDALVTRARLALDILEKLPHDNIMVVSHGAFGRALRHHILDDFPFEHPDRIQNAQLVELI